MVLQTYGGRSEFLGKFNPDMQITVAKNEERAFMGIAPTLGLLKKTYGENMAVMWLLPQIWDLCEFTNSRNKLDERQAENLAEMISLEYGYMKVTELLLFFYRFKTGRYGRFYGSVDPMAIMIALEEFGKERQQALVAYEEKKKQQEREQISKNASMIDCEAYCKGKGYPIMHNINEIILYEIEKEKLQSQA